MAVDHELPWFATVSIADGVWLIAEPLHVNSYLIVGSTAAVLIDSGLGIRSIRREVESITDLPVTVVNSHHHFDHVGGNHEFDRLAVHETAAELATRPQPDDWLPAYLEFEQQLQEEHRALDPGSRSRLAPEQRLRPLPVDFVRDAWRTTPRAATRLLAEGDELDLGDRVLTVLHTPGHTIDSICLLDAERRALFTGDTICTGELYAHLPTADLEQYATSAHRLADEIAPRVDTLFTAHSAVYRSDPELLARIAAALDAVLKGTETLVGTEDCFGSAVDEAIFGDFSVVVPPSSRSDRAQPR